MPWIKCKMVCGGFIASEACISINVICVAGICWGLIPRHTATFEKKTFWGHLIALYSKYIIFTNGILVMHLLVDLIQESALAKCTHYRLRELRTWDCKILYTSFIDVSFQWIKAFLSVSKSIEGLRDFSKTGEQRFSAGYIIEIIPRAV